jgi:hypothetical protein
MVTFNDLWWKQTSRQIRAHREAIADLYKRRHAEQRRMWRPRSNIEDLADSAHRRFLYDPESKTT